MTMRTYHKRVAVGAVLLLVMALGLVMSTATARAADGDVSVNLDGEELALDVPGQISDGRTLVPFRAIFEALGADVTWNARSQTVSAERGKDSLVLTIGSRVVEWRGSTIKVDAPPVIIDGRTLVPLRLVAQALGLNVRWDGAERTVYLESSPDDYRLAQGIRIVHDKGCMVCHTINGAGGQVGPVLNGVTDRHGEEWLKTWLANPQAVRAGSRMPNFHFSEDEIDSVVRFLTTLQ